MLNPWISILLVLSALIGLMIGLRVYGAKRKPHPEILRKMLHVGMGLIVLSFPWVFAETWPVWVLAGVSVILLAVTKIPSPLQHKLGGVLDGVDRSSLGDIYFPISVALLFHFSDRQPVLYCIPILLLALADAVAALIGVFYGHRHYQATGGIKSAEGSIAFFVVAFLSTHIPLLLFTNIGRAESLLLGLTIGLLVMIIEAVSWNGLDNLMVPLGAFLFLTGYMSMDKVTLATLLVATFAWVVLVFALRCRSTLNDSALVGAALSGYLIWTLGGWLWSIPPLLAYLSYTILWPRKEQLIGRPHDTKAVAAFCVPGILCLSIARSYDRWELLFPYTVFYAIQLSFIGIAYFREMHLKTANPKLIALCVIKGWIVQFVPFALIKGLSITTLIYTGFAFGPIVIATLMFNYAIPQPENYSIDRFPWMLQTAIGSIASALCLIPLYCWR